jgi:hypothetical protein
VTGHAIGNQLDLTELGITMAHETAHSLGLYHTSERQAGGLHDLISDTPECPASADLDGDGLLSPEECADYDAGNLLFWTGSGNTALSSGQAEILLAAPIVSGR